MSDARTSDPVSKCTSETRRAAYALATANLHKAWARRWMRANGYWL